MATIREQYEILSDDNTVWINAANGMCIARFGPRGIDIHHDFEGQQLDCEGAPTNLAAWRRFQTAVRRHWAIGLDDQHMPAHIRKELYRHG